MSLEGAKCLVTGSSSGIGLLKVPGGTSPRSPCSSPTDTSSITSWPISRDLPCGMARHPANTSCRGRRRCWGDGQQRGSPLRRIDGVGVGGQPRPQHVRERESSVRDNDARDTAPEEGRGGGEECKLREREAVLSWLRFLLHEQGGGRHDDAVRVRGPGQVRDKSQLGESRDGTDAVAEAGGTRRL
ncbi:hypothetical protein THAOC_17653 [Thalassiosira oceanica]|uniref:Uncharacterized protein n=1 Tax=Thalassiosira oceanica TaxID=159749 RepID=K0S928_THAOC|nr:hypothetical protein THAOC_17653 [Thalassiosira oceanica]|eukprot:EJK61795.1 hypothetical protein THAOC_17653 [Thalassiosira oceanica]